MTLNSHFEAKIVLITGGTGSFGTTLCKKLLSLNCAEIRIFSRDEKKQEDLRNELMSSRCKFFIGDVRDPSSVVTACRGVDYIFHAAALKQVPSCEFHPYEAYLTNVVGTNNVLEAAYSANVNKVVVLSTDKAVYPINAMGISKAMAERLVFAKSRLYSVGQPLFSLTRYGNVMASRGSVIPLFVNQILSGKQLTITNPNMTRFIMSLDDAVNLVLYAFLNANPGELFIHKAPSCTVGNLAEALQSIFNTSLPTRIIGTRHGEKLYETLMSSEEKARSVDDGTFFRILPDNRNLDYSKYEYQGDSSLDSITDYNSSNTTLLTVPEIVETLLSLPFIKSSL